MAGQLNVAICVPYRGADRHRANLWECVSTRLAHYGTVIAADAGGTMFSRAASRNLAARMAIDQGAEVLIFNDSDMFLEDGDAYQRLAELAASPGTGLAIGYTEFRTLTQRATDRVLHGGDPWRERPARTLRATDAVGWYLVGGIFACTVDAWRTVGGMDERFEGWGCEDTCLDATLETLVGARRRVTQPAIHLYHRWLGKTAAPTNTDLSERYGAARGDRAAMRAILTEPGGPLNGEHDT